MVNEQKSYERELTSELLGSFMNFEDVKKALIGVYGAFVNTDGFTVPMAQEIHAGIRIFEIAKSLGTIKHYVWSNLDYSLKVS